MVKKMVRSWVVIALLCIYNCITLYGMEEDEIEQLTEDDFSITGLDILTELNPSKTDRGDPIIQGDIVVPPGEKAEDLKGIVNRLTLWNGAKVPYKFHDSVDEDLKVIIIEAMEHWETHSCLKFTDKVKGLDSYLHFRGDKKGCWSMIGKIHVFPVRAHDVSLGRGCNKIFIAIHEIGHAIGFYHEQSRNDRDGYIKILWENMSEDKYTQFDKGIENPRGVKYDYISIMHYGPMAFSNKHFQKNTIVALNPHYQTLIGSGRVLSFRDKKLVNIMYNCNSKCPNKNDTMCLNGGYLSPYRDDKEPCHCICPPRISGEHCEKKERNTNENEQQDEEEEDEYQYYEMPQCGGNITEETTIQTPGYPERKPPKDNCVWWIQAPPEKHVRVEFVDFSFHPRAVSNLTVYHMKCRYESVEIRTRTRYNGDKFCGEDIPPGTVATSRKNEFIIIIDTKEEYMVGRGLKAIVTFVEGEKNEEGSGEETNESGNDESGSDDYSQGKGDSEQSLSSFLP